MNPKIKTISMIECFGVFSEVIAVVCIGSQFAAVRTSLPSHRRVGADLASARANEMGEASIARLVLPVSARGITEGWELSPAPQKLERPFAGQPKPCPRFDSRAPVAPHAGRGEPAICGTEEPPRCCNSRHPDTPVVMPPTRTEDPSRGAFVGANRLFAGLVLHQVRPRDHSGIAPEQRVGSCRNLNPVSSSVPVPDARTVLMLGKRPLTIAQVASQDSPLAPLENMLVE
jgi:hypothetical protein